MEMSIAKVTSQGQITIPADIRRRLGIQPGGKVMFIQEGDRVLIETGRYIRGAVPGDAKVYRIGGDEFGVLFRGAMEREEIFLLLNDMRRDYAVTTPDGTRQTITIGMATAFEDASRCAELIRKADGALYRGGEDGAQDQPLHPGPAAAAGQALQARGRRRGHTAAGGAGHAAEEIRHIMLTCAAVENML